MSGSIRFLLGKETVELSDFDPQLTVLEWLRTEPRRMGTKEGCAEGDCGACTVVLVELSNGALRYRAYNACILLLATLDGKQLLTVEDLSEKGLHPVQQALVENHGSQCGFCTPGFVMSLFALYHAEKPDPLPQREAIDRCLAGNLCRCTGYAPIIKAAGQALRSPASDTFTVSSDETTLALRDLQPSSGAHIEFEGRNFFAPRSADELSSLLEQHPDAAMVAGATDVGLWITKQQKLMAGLIYTCNVPELREIKSNSGLSVLEIGGAVSYSDARNALTDLYPDFAPLLDRLGAIQVRNAGTIGGNIANGSPIGDMPPPLIVLDARLVLRSSSGRREIALEDFFIGYGKQDLRPGEFLEKVLLPFPPDQQQFRVYKLSKRFDQDISSVCAAFALRPEGDRVGEIRICFGGMAGTPARATGAERVLTGARWNSDNIELAKTALAEDYQPLTDWRASREYRLLSAQNLLQRFYLESTGQAGVQIERWCGESG